MAKSLTLQEKLTIAEDKLFYLQTGGLPYAYKDQNGEEVDLTRTSVAILESLCANLRLQIKHGGRMPPRHAIRVIM